MGGEDKKMLGDFWKGLVWALLENEYYKRDIEEDDEQDTRKVRKRLTEHKLVSGSCYVVRCDGKNEGKGKLKYPQFT